VTNPTLIGLLSIILGGGFIGALVALYTARKKVPVERDNLIVSGAETAVLSLERTLAAETRRADRAEAKVATLEDALARKDRRIEALEKRLDDFQAALDLARAELHAIRTAPH
jgi:predicted RNase H-like nuclease (RuvC/YqgF family)